MTIIRRTMEECLTEREEIEQRLLLTYGTHDRIELADVRYTGKLTMDQLNDVEELGRLDFLIGDRAAWPCCRCCAEDHAAAWRAAQK